MVFGFKMIVRKEWMDETLSLVLDGKNVKEIRSFLDEYLSTQKPSGGIGPKRNRATYGMAFALLGVWYRDAPELESMQKRLIAVARKTHREDWMPLHWAMLASAYPFWVMVNEQAGNLFGLQDVITAGQVYARMKDILGDTQTVARNTRFAIATMVSWGLVEKTDKIGHYRKGKTMCVGDMPTALLLESVLRATEGRRSEFNELALHRSLYCFSLASMSATTFSIYSKPYIEMNQYGLTGEYVSMSVPTDRK